MDIAQPVVIEWVCMARAELPCLKKPVLAKEARKSFAKVARYVNVHQKALLGG
jgi:hypothetical protein